MTGVYAYLRASTDHQDASVPAQKTAIAEFCRQQEYYVVVWSLSRFSRVDPDDFIVEKRGLHPRVARM